jgi:arsenical pump membrane protein
VVVTAVLSNDATALLLTPFAFAVARRLGLNPRPSAFACALVANAASFVLPVSNPANLLVLSRAPLPLGAFLARLLLPSVLAITLTLAGLLLIFRKELAAPFALPSGATHRLDRRTAVSLGGLGALTVLYLVASALGWPLGAVATAGAMLLVILDVLVAGWQPRALLHEVPWTLFPLLAGLLLLVGGAERIDLVAPFVRWLEASAGLGLAGLPVALLGIAALANVLNNLPAALVAASALGSLSPGIERSDLAAAVIVGVNLGPNLTTIGSLATMLCADDRAATRRGGIGAHVLSGGRRGGRWELGSCGRTSRPFDRPLTRPNAGFPFSLPHDAALIRICNTLTNGLVGAKHAHQYASLGPRGQGRDPPRSAQDIVIDFLPETAARLHSGG